MGEAVASVIVAAITTLGTVGAAYLAARSGKGPFRKVEEASVWKERAELADAKVELLEQRLAEREEALVEERARRIFAEREADAASRRLDNLYAELRLSGKLVDRRRAPREEGADDR